MKTPNHPRLHAPPRSARHKTGAITLRALASWPGVGDHRLACTQHAGAWFPGMLARVREAVARTGCDPNLLAGGLASSRSRLVAALVPTIAGPIFLETIRALTRRTGSAGFQLMLGQAVYATHARTR